MRELVKMSMAVALAVLVGFGCASGSKINLAGLEENAPGSIGDDGKGTGTAIGSEVAGIDDAEGGLKVADLNGGNGAGDGTGAGAGKGLRIYPGQRTADAGDPVDQRESFPESVYVPGDSGTVFRDSEGSGRT